MEDRIRASKGQAKKAREKPFGAHRVAVLLHHDAEAVQKMLFADHHASHLCHQPICINHEHIVVEKKADNEARKSCKGKVSKRLTLRFRTYSKKLPLLKEIPQVVVKTIIHEQQFALPPSPCPHNPPCLFLEEWREAIPPI